MPPSKVIREHSGQMVQACFGGAIGEGLERRNKEAVYAADVNNTRGVFGGSSIFEKWGEELCYCEDAVQV